MIVKCVAACFNAEGSPDFYFCKVKLHADEYNNSDHYDLAVEAAVEAGYSPPIIVFDENDGPNFLFEHFVWDSADTVGEAAD